MNDLQHKSKILIFTPVYRSHRPAYNDPHANFINLRGKWKNSPQAKRQPLPANVVPLRRGRVETRNRQQ